MRDRKSDMAELRTVLSTERFLDSNNTLAYEALIQCCDIYEAKLDSISRLQFEEEFDAFVFVAALIKSRRSADDEARASFAEFVNKLLTRPFHASLWMCAEVIDWGCYLQKKDFPYWYLLCKQSPGVMALIIKRFDRYISTYKDRLDIRKSLHEESYTWYVKRSQQLRESMKEEKLLLAFSPLFFLVPFSLCAAVTCYAASKKNALGREIFDKFLVTFFLSIPIVNLVSAVLLGIYMHVALKENREQLQKQPWKGDLIVAKPAVTEESHLNKFRRTLKSDQQYYKDYLVQGKSRGARVKNKESATDLMDKEQALRREFYLQQWQASRSNQTKAPETKDLNEQARVTDFFNDLNRSKQRSKAIKHEVWKMHGDPTYRPILAPSPRSQL